MANVISILIQAKDAASKVISGVGKSLDDAGKKVEEHEKKFQNVNKAISAFTPITLAAGAATYSLIGLFDSSFDAANRLQGAMTGLNSVARAFNQDADKATKAARSLADDGLMTVADAATGLKNLLAAGFQLPEAITLMKRFKDSAAFGRQSALSFGQAISSATEGIKNGNSILVDNAGVTKNLSMMLTDAGYSAQDLMKATSDAGVRQAIFNGILKETNAQAGDAARLADSAAGKQAVWAAQTEVLRQEIGIALQPALLALLQTVTPMLTAVADWISKNPELASGILIVTTGALGLITVAGSLGLAIMGLGPVFTVMSTVGIAAIGGLQTAFVGLGALIASPLAMPAIGVAAALASLWAVQQAANAARAAIDESMAANNRETKASVDIMKGARARFDRGEISFEQMRKLVGIAAKASGTGYAAGGTTLVGEHGPELVNLPSGARVTPAWQTRSEGAQQGAGGVTNILSGNFTFTTAESVESFFKRIDKTQRLAKVGMA